MTREEAIRIAQGLITDFKCESETMVDFCNTVIKALEQTRWISVSERLPEVDVDVFVTDNGGGVPTVTMDACGMKDDTGERFWYVSQTPIAWMELPEPYKAEGEDKLDGNPVDIDKAVEHYEGTLEVLKGINLEVDDE